MCFKNRGLHSQKYKSIIFGMFSYKQRIGYRLVRSFPHEENKVTNIKIRLEPCKNDTYLHARSPVFAQTPFLHLQQV